MPIGALGMAGVETAKGIVNAGLGLALQRSQDKRQINMSRKLQRMQMEGDKEMTDYNYGKQLEMWNATGYGAQMKQLKDAGLNAGLLYGQGGGGGQTTNIETGKTNTGHAPTGGGEVQALMGMALQRELLQAQKENIQAETAKTKAETANVPITGENIKAQTASLTQGIQNQQAQAELTKIETSIKEIDWDIMTKNENFMIAKLRYETEEAHKTVQGLTSQNKITAAEAAKIEKTIQYRLANTAMDTWLKGKEGQGITQEVRESIDRMKTAYQNRLMQVDQQSNQNMGTDEDILNNADNAFPDELKGILQAIGLGSAAKTTIKGKPTEIRGLHKRN